MLICNNKYTLCEGYIMYDKDNPNLILEENEMVLEGTYTHLYKMDDCSYTIYVEEWANLEIFGVEQDNGLSFTVHNTTVKNLKDVVSEYVESYSQMYSYSSKDVQLQEVRRYLSEEYQGLQADIQAIIDFINDNKDKLVIHDKFSVYDKTNELLSTLNKYLKQLQTNTEHAKEIAEFAVFNSWDHDDEYEEGDE